MKMQQKHLTGILSWLVVGLVAVLFAKTLRENWNELGDLQLRPDIFIVLALVCFVMSIVASGISWGRIINKLTNKSVPVSEAIRIHLASWLLKYVPGQAGSFLNKVAWAKRRGIDGKKVTASFIYENAFLVLASVALSAPVLIFALSEKFGEDFGLFVPLIVALPIVVLVMTPKMFEISINSLFKILKKQKLSRSELFSSKDNLNFTLEFMIPRIINGSAFVFLTISMLGIDAGLYFVFGAIYVLAGIIGLLAIFVPSGLGVREAVITLFASAYIPVEQAIALALAARFYATIADILVALLYVSLKQRKVNNI